jgi:tetratricopeptide (TPR) repeat protein
MKSDRRWSLTSFSILVVVVQSISIFSSLRIAQAENSTSDPEKKSKESLLYAEAKSADFDKALSIYNELVRSNPDKWLQYRAYLFRSNNRNEEARQDYERLIALRTSELLKLHKGSVEYTAVFESLGMVYCQLASVLEKEKLIDLASENYKKAVDTNGGFWVDYADFCERQGLKAEYLVSLNALVSLMPEKYLSRRGQFFETNMEYDHALEDYTRLVKIARRFGLKDGYSPLAWGLKCRAEFYEHQGNQQLAKNDRARYKKYSLLQQKLFGFSAWPKR